MVRLVLTCVDSPWAFELRPGLNTLGRNPTNDCRVSDPSVSSFHCELTVEGTRVRVRDLDSTNGTFLDGQKVQEGFLSPEKSLRLGSVDFKLEMVPVAEVAAVPSGRPAAAPAIDMANRCAYHPDAAAAYRCENCGGLFCAECVRIVGHERSTTTTCCPLCHGQCHPLHAPKGEVSKEQSLLRRLTQTLKIPFAR